LDTMSRVNINIGEVVSSIESRLSVLENNELYLRPVCFDLIDKLTYRIHVKGEDSNNKAIGTYSEGYMKVRTGTDFKSEVIARGPLKGKPREKYNRAADTKVICSLTRQLENDWNVIETTGGYGIGFLNELNFKKTGWLEHTYQKKIFALTEQELAFAVESINETVNGLLNE